jgi:hypothetical protein
MAYLNHKIGVEVQVDEGDSIDEAFALAKRMVEIWNVESNPGYATALEYMGIDSSVHSENKTPREISAALLIQDIMNETVLRQPDGTGGLMQWQHFVKGHPELQSIFDKKLKELQDGAK